MLNFNGKIKKRKIAHIRSKYVDKTSYFTDWVERLGLEKGYFAKFVNYFNHKMQFKMFFLLFLFSWILSLVLFFEVDFDENYRIGDIVTSDIKSPVYLEFIDENATDEKRKEVEASIPLVFDYDPEIYENISNNIYNSFRLMRKSINNIKWTENELQRQEQVKDFLQYKKDFEKSFGFAVPDRIFEWLVNNKFNVFIENLLLYQLEKWSEFKIVDNLDKYINTNIDKNEQKIIIRPINNQSKSVENIVYITNLIDDNDPQLLKLMGGQNIQQLDSRDISNLEKLISIIFTVNLTINLNESNLRKQRARDEVLPVVIIIKKNQLILTEGTIIRPIHITILREIKKIKQSRKHNFNSVIVSLLFFTLILVFFSYFRRFSHNRVKVASKDILVMSFVSFFVVVATKIYLFIVDAAFLDKFGDLVPEYFFLYLAPVACGPMLVGLLINSGEILWLFTFFIAFVISIMVDMNFPFLLVTVVGGIAAARGVYTFKKRNDLYLAGLRTGLINALVIALVINMQHTDNILKAMLWNVSAGFFSGIFASMIAQMLIPILEIIFNYTTDIRLLELSNLNHPLLKDMLVKAPGTYHHSMIVGSMIEAAAEKIGANSLLAKVMAYYHDIGKIEHANYFIENQRRGHNPHDNISPYMSKTILIAHVKDGVEIGMRHNLGEEIIDGILQHHGTSLIAFFHNKALEYENNEIDQVAEDEFRYPGPKPQFIESGLLMLADSIEAAARSLEEPTTIRLQNIVRNIIQRKFMEGQLDQCNLTLRDLSIIEKSFVKILIGIYHQRIDYPKNSGGGMSDTPDKMLLLASEDINN